MDFIVKQAMDELRDLIREAKIRTAWWILCIFGVSYFLAHTSKSMLMNIPIAILLVSGLRMLFNEVEFRWRVRNINPTSYLSYLERKQLSVNDSRLTAWHYPRKWKRKIDSPVVEAALEDFVRKLLQDFVINLWYSDITPDKEGPELIHDIIMDVLREVSVRLKEVNLVDLLTRDAVELIGDHIEIFRRNQSAIGKDIMGTLSSEERDERLKHHLLASKELHPALISPECEYKVIQQLTKGLLAVVLRRREAQCPLVRCVAREILTCCILQPIMSLASPWYINELIESIIVAYKDKWLEYFTSGPPLNVERHNCDHIASGGHGSNEQATDTSDNKELESGGSGNISPSTMQDEPIQPRPAEWAKAYEAATQIRTEVLMPENLENMWAMGIKYKKKFPKRAAPELQALEVTRPVSVVLTRKDVAPETPKRKPETPKRKPEAPKRKPGTLKGKPGTQKVKPETSTGIEDKSSKQFASLLQQDSQPTHVCNDGLSSSQDLNRKIFTVGVSNIHESENTANVVSYENGNKDRSDGISDSEVHSNMEHVFTSKSSSPVNTETYNADVNKLKLHRLKSSSATSLHNEDLHVPKLRCEVIGADFEKIGSKSFAVYSIAVFDADNNSWIVKRRYRNFDRLHRQLKEIPNYTLHLPPKRIFLSSTEDSLVYDRCIQLNKYLQDVLSIANVAEHIEVWDFLSAASENYSIGKPSSGEPSSVITTLAVNVDGAVGDIVRQFKGVSDGLMRMVVRSPTSSAATSGNSSLNPDEPSKLTMGQNTPDSLNSFSDNEEGDRDHQETEYSPPTNSDIESNDDPTGVLPEWTPPNLTVPVLNLVDKIFLLKRRGWIRRQVFWISKQILQLVMEDAIDDWLLRQIQWLRRDDVIAQGIRWLKGILWPDGNFFMRLCIQSKLKVSEANQGSQSATLPCGRKGFRPISFEQQLQAARRARDIKKMIFDGAPTALVSLVGHKQYRRCARDIYYFIQSTICLKQLGYGMLELGLVTVFPELRDLVADIHEKMLKHHA